jgi:hypothetical protein
LTDATVEGDSGALASALRDDGLPCVVQEVRKKKWTKMPARGAMIAPPSSLTEDESLPPWDLLAHPGLQGEVSNRQMAMVGRRRLEEGLEIPVDAPVARTMMESMGWREGQSLGAASSDGLLTPLAPNIGRDYWDKKGTGASKWSSLWLLRQQWFALRWRYAQVLF